MCGRAHGQQWLEGDLRCERTLANQDRRGPRSCTAVLPRDLCEKYTTKKTEKAATKYATAGKDSQPRGTVLSLDIRRRHHTRREDASDERAEASVERCGHERCLAGCLFFASGQSYAVWRRAWLRSSSEARSPSSSTPKFRLLVWVLEGTLSRVKTEVKLTASWHSSKEPWQSLSFLQML